MMMEVSAKARPKAVAINAMPLWSVCVITARGDDSPRYRSVSFKAMAGNVEEVKVFSEALSRWPASSGKGKIDVDLVNASIVLSTIYVRM